MRNINLKSLCLLFTSDIRKIQGKFKNLTAETCVITRFLSKSLKETVMCAFDLSSPSRQKLSLVSIQRKDSGYCHPIPDGILESLNNQDGDGNENGKKAIGLDWQNNNSARTSRFLDISGPSLHGYNVKVPKFTFCRGGEHKTTTSPFFQNFEFNSKKNLSTFDELNEME